MGQSSKLGDNIAGRIKIDVSINLIIRTLAISF